VNLNKLLGQYVPSCFLTTQFFLTTEYILLFQGRFCTREHWSVSGRQSVTCWSYLQEVSAKQGQGLSSLASAEIRTKTKIPTPWSRGPHRSLQDLDGALSPSGQEWGAIACLTMYTPPGWDAACNPHSCKGRNKRHSINTLTVTPYIWCSFNIVIKPLYWFACLSATLLLSVKDIAQLPVTGMQDKNRRSLHMRVILKW
jgi:hypothetical protein